MSRPHSVENLRKPTENESCILQIDTSNTVLDKNTENNETQQKNENTREIVLKVDSLGRANRYPGHKRVLPITWVYFQQDGAHIPPDGGPALDYQPDRNSFVRLVFFITFVMIACTAGITTVVHLVEELSDLFKQYGLIFAIAALVIMISLNYAMACCACTRTVPWNYLCLCIAVIGMSMMCCYVTVRYDTTIVLLAVMATAGVVFVCLLIACSRFDFTKWYLYVVVIALAFGMVSMVVSLYMLISGNYIRILHLVMLSAGTVISSIILVMELQMILGGKTIELSEDDYALGAYLLYTSIIDIFLKLVTILGILDD